MFLIELTPTTLVYLTKLMDSAAPVATMDVMTHAGIRQQLASPAETSKITEQFKAQGAQEVRESLAQ